MALQAWVGRSAAQLDADSPLDITLHNSIDDDLIHLRQVLYGDGAGAFRTPIDGHNHLTGNSAPLGADTVGSSQIAANAVGASEIAPDAVGASEIAPDAVGASEIAANAVGNSEISKAHTGQTTSVNNGVTYTFGAGVITTINAQVIQPTNGIQFNGNGVWGNSQADASGTVFSDGGNVRVTNNAGSAQNLYWDTQN